MMLALSKSRLVMIGVAATGAFALGTWVYIDVQRELRTLAAANLRSLLDTQIGALDTWIREKHLNVVRWAQDSRIVNVAIAQTRLASKFSASGSHSALTAACRGDASATLIREVNALRQSDAVEGVNLVDRSGTVLATRTAEYCGVSVTPGRLQQLSPVFAGQSTFASPMSERERLGSAVKPEARRPLVWFSAPVRDETGAIVAALNVGKFADARFSSALVAARPGLTGEAYAFDAAGRMLSESRFRTELEQRGAIKTGDSTILSVRLDDPDDVGQTQSLTALAALALAGKANSDAVLAGEVLQPYPNYVGRPVLGAWRWLPQYGFGVAVEVGRDEVFAPLRRIETVYGLVVVLGGLALLTLLASGVWIHVLRGQRDAARRLGSYELLEQIAEGGMATVWRARHRLLKRPVAIKLMSLRLANDEGLARFEREVRLASRLMHPNTVATFDYGRAPTGEPFSVMELLDGLTVQQLVERHGPQSTARVALVMRGIAGSLLEAHQRGMVHRDIKPANVMLCRQGAEVDVVKVLDFGLVKSIVEPHTRDLTRALRVLGTPSYMAPERIELPSSADARSDIYSLGALAYFMRVGKPPYQAESDLALAYQVINAPVPALAPDDRLNGLVQSCLQKAADDRPQNAQQVIDLLDQVLHESPWTTADARAWWAGLADTASACSQPEPTIRMI